MTINAYISFHSLTDCSVRWLLLLILLAFTSNLIPLSFVAIIFSEILHEMNKKKGEGEDKGNNAINVVME